MLEKSESCQEREREMERILSVQEEKTETEKGFLDAVLLTKLSKGYFASFW